MGYIPPYVTLKTLKMQIFNDIQYKVQLPGYQVGGYTIDDKYLAAEDEQGELVLFPAGQVLPGEMVNWSNMIMLNDGYSGGVKSFLEQNPHWPKRNIN